MYCLRDKAGADPRGGGSLGPGKDTPRFPSFGDHQKRGCVNALFQKVRENACKRPYIIKKQYIKPSYFASLVTYDLGKTSTEVIVFPQLAHGSGRAGRLK